MSGKPGEVSTAQVSHRLADVPDAWVARYARAVWTH